MAGLLDYLSNVKFEPNAAGMGLLNMGAQILANSGPSALPQSPFQSLGHGINGFAQGFDQQKAIEAAHAAAQQKALLDASTIKENEAKAGYYTSGGSGSDGYHQPIQTAQGWAQWDPQTKNYGIIQLNNKPALPVSADVNLAGNIAGAKADAGNTMQTLNDGRQVLTRNSDITGQYNNPGNIRPEGQSIGFQQFDSPEDGLAAIDKNLSAYGSKHGINTLSGVINRWAPPSENNTQAYIDDVSKRLNLHPDQPIDLNNPVVRQALSTAITLHENGAANIFGQSTAAKEAAQVPAHVDEEARKTAAKIESEAAAKAKTDLPNTIANADYTAKLLTELADHPGMSGVIGMPNLAGLVPFPGTKEADFKARLDQLKGRTFLQAFDSLKGGGQITEVEGAKATDAIARLQRSQTEESFKSAANELKDIINNAKIRAQQKSGITRGEQPANQNQPHSGAKFLGFE